MPSPSGIFTSLTEAQLLAKEAKALERIDNADIIGLGGSGKSTSKTYPMTPQEILIEVKFARDKRNGTLPPRRLYADMNGSEDYYGNYTLQ